MYSPCFECINRYGKQYTEECDNTCDYAYQLSRFKPYGGINDAEAILAELYKKHQETGECGVYEITSDKQLGEKVDEL